jgi:hypothetical protein
MRPKNSKGYKFMQSSFKDYVWEKESFCSLLASACRSAEHLFCSLSEHLLLLTFGFSLLVLTGLSAGRNPPSFFTQTFILHERQSDTQTIKYRIQRLYGGSESNSRPIFSLPNRGKLNFTMDDFSFGLFLHEMNWTFSY